MSQQETTMPPLKPPNATSSPSSSSMPLPPITPEEAARRSAAARAYALSSSTGGAASATSVKNANAQNASSSTNNANANANANASTSAKANNVTNTSYFPPRNNSQRNQYNPKTITANPRLITSQHTNSNTPGGYGHGTNVGGNTNTNPNTNIMTANNNTSNMNAQQQVQHRLNELEDIGDDEYAKFVRGLLVNDDTSYAGNHQTGGSSLGRLGGLHRGSSSVGSVGETEDDEEDYEEDYAYPNDDDEEEDDEDEDAGGEDDAASSADRKSASAISSQETASTDQKMSGDELKPVGIDDYDFDELDLDPIALEEELGGLLEEDMEAAVNSLIQQDISDLNILHVPMPIMPLHAEGAGAGSGSASASNASNNASNNAAAGNAITSTHPPSSTTAAQAHTNANFPIQPLSPTARARATATTPTHIHTPSKAATSAATSASKFPTPSHRQIIHLQQLMNQHYQILLQQSALAVRAAHGNKFKNRNGGSKRKRQEHFFCCGETADDLAGIVDGAVTMLQDLDKNRKDAIRYSIQMSRVNYKRHKGNGHGHGFGKNISAAVGKSGNVAGTGFGPSMGGSGVSKIHGFYPQHPPSAARAILGDDGQDNNRIGNEQNKDHMQEGILTRSAFSRTLRESDYAAAINPAHGFGIHAARDHSESSNSKLGSNTTFGVRGLARLDETFAAIDNSLSAQSATDSNGVLHPVSSMGRMKPALNRLHDAENIFLEPRHGRACEILLRHARADYDRNLIPGYRELSHLLTYPSEIMGREEGMPMSDEQQKSLRSNRPQFTAAEDNLLLRGVNLYGEKEWMFISDRFLPDRSVSIIAQRYWRLCLLIYRGHGIHIDQNGNFREPPKMPNGIDDFDEFAILQALKAVQQPVAFGLYRWSMEEDILLLKAVPLMGRMFAEIGKRFVPYRDRGALRKRYQVLERRVKGAIKRDKKILRENRAKATPIKVASNKTASVNYTANTLKQLQPSNVAPSSSYGRMATNAPAQTYSASGDYYSRPLPNTNAAYPPASRREIVPSTMVSNIHPQPSSDSFSSAALGRVIEGEWSQMGRIIEQDTGTGTKSRFEDRHPAGCAPPHSTAGSQYPPQRYPAPYAPQYLPSLGFNDGSLSGLSMLGDSIQGEHSQIAAASGAKRKGESIMNSVMKRTNESMPYSHRPPSESARGVSTVVQGKDDHNNNLKPSSAEKQGVDKTGFHASPPANRQINSNLNFSQLGSTIHMGHGFEHSLMAPPELDAISVLNQMQMSNSSIGGLGKSKYTAPSSPFKPPRNSDLERKRNVNSNAFIPQRASSTKKSSFLDKVKQKVVASKKK